MEFNILVLLVVAISVQLSTAQNQQDVCKGVPDNNFVANPDDCSTFYICVGELGSVEKCPPGTQFDYLKGYCSFDDDVACKSVEETTEAASESTESESMTTTAETLTTVVSTSTPSVITTEKDMTEITQTTETTETTTVVSSTAEEFCRTVDPNTLKFLPSATSCEQYFICMNGKPLQLHCASGSHWNNEMQFCDDPKRANCQVSLHIFEIRSFQNGLHRITAEFSC